MLAGRDLFADLLAAARAGVQAVVPHSHSLPPPVEADAKALGDWLLATYVRAGHSGIEFHLHPGRFVNKVSPRPTASPLARLQAASGNAVTNLRHESITLGEFERHLLLLLDGKHDRTRSGTGSSTWSRGRAQG